MSDHLRNFPEGVVYTFTTQSLNIPPTFQQIMDTYPLHVCSWTNDVDRLQFLLSEGNHDIKQFDHRGNTSLHIAAMQCNKECVEALLNAGANPKLENSSHWTAIQEAVATKNVEIAETLIKNSNRESELSSVRELFNKLRDSPDFYVEMGWEFGSWIPFVSRMCPNDTYKIYKYGANVRMDMTLVGYEGNEWKRGKISLIFKQVDDKLQFIELNHDLQTAYVEEISDQQSPTAIQGELDRKLRTPLVTNFVDLEKITFDRSRSFFGVGGEKNEDIDGFNCRVYTANDVALTTQIRYDHMSEEDMDRLKDASGPENSPLTKLFMPSKMPTSKETSPVSMENYFDPSFDMEGYHIGVQKRENVQVQHFKASLWLCDEFPLSVKEQILPVIDLFAEQNPYFEKLREFITLQLPAGFPVKIEVPIFHVIKARVTFSNPCANQSPVPGVTCLREENATYCSVDEDCFEIPSRYRPLGRHSRRTQQHQAAEEDLLFQMAIQNSISTDNGNEGEGIQWSLDSEDVQLQRAIMASMVAEAETDDAVLVIPPPVELPAIVGGLDDDELAQALALSKEEARLHDEREKREEEELNEALRLSVLDDDTSK